MIFKKYLIGLLLPCMLFGGKSGKKEKKTRERSTDSAASVQLTPFSQFHPYYYSCTYAVKPGTSKMEPKPNVPGNLENDVANEQKYTAAYNDMRKSLQFKPAHLHASIKGVFNEADDEIALRVTAASTQSAADQLESLFYVFKLYTQHITSLIIHLNETKPIGSEYCESATAFFLLRLSTKAHYGKEAEQSAKKLISLIPERIVSNLETPEATFREHVTNLANAIKAVLPLKGMRHEIAHSMKQQTYEIAKIYVALSDLFLDTLPSDQLMDQPIIFKHFSEISTSLIRILLTNTHVLHFYLYHFKMKKFVKKEWQHYTESWLIEFFLSLYSTFMVNEHGDCPTLKEMKEKLAQ